MLSSRAAAGKIGAGLFNCWATTRELLVTDFVSGLVISCDDPIDCRLGSSNALSTLADNQHVLLVLVIWLRRRVLLLRVLAADEDFAACLFLEALLVEALGANKHTDVIDASVLW
eukprot:CAMPEP_0170457904 /NCGR_PEP_ID=MMETSP0123-20130129/5038_1 /TAXON_ID=182087 /ORGANISM="Favella ehrenbergii, Strain Fehren 1" /LENGTH=114 /DNA_ID=CAMNT_0010721847 /DNA_START=1836 /DNA_END=2177 /DNA_ORIENTATION=+